MDLINIIKENSDFEPPTYFDHTTTLIKGYIGAGTKMGEGWLLTAEMLELAEKGIDVSFANTEFPADETSVNIYTDENKTDYNAILSAVGSEKIITVFDENGNEVADMFGSVEEGTFEDLGVEKNNVNISLRPEGTSGVIRSYLENKFEDSLKQIC